MRKFMIVCLLLISGSGITKAQLDGSGIAPDFTLTDLDGQEHRLYAWLDQNKIVVLDFFAVWCTICKADAEYLDRIYTSYGPAGSDQIMMLSLETDDSSTDQQTEAFRNEFGAGNPYFNQTGDVALLYNQQFFPLYYVVAPDRSYQVIEGRQERLQTELAAAIEAAPLLRTIENDARVLSYSSPVGSLCDNKFYPLIRVQNYGTNTIDQMIINTLINDTIASSFPWLEDIEPYQIADIRLPWVINLPNGWHDIRFVFEDVNAGPDGEPGNGITGGEFLIVSDGEQLGIEVTTDPYPKETRITLLEDNKLLASLDGYEKGLHTDTSLVCVQPDACYRLILHDLYGDGMRSGGVRVLYRGEEIAALDGAAFSGDSTWVDFCVWPLGVEKITTAALSQVTLYPNPAAGEVMIRYPEVWTQSVDLEVVDATGRIVWTGTDHRPQNIFRLDLSDYAPGLYFVHLKTSEATLTRRLVVTDRL